MFDFEDVCDTHLHFYDAAYPADKSAVLFPPDASPDDYRSVQAAVGSRRLVVVQPTTYGMDNRCQLAGMEAFGDAARGVMVVDSNTSTAELADMTERGVLGARFHMLPGGAVPWSELEPTAARIAPFGWHIQLQLDGNTLSEYTDRLVELPVDLVIDHIGRFMPPPLIDDPAMDDSALDDPAVDALLGLLANRRTWVKLSAPYESQITDFTIIQPLVERLVNAAPDRLLWATNWPHPGQQDPPGPSELVDLAIRWLPSESLRQQVLVDNPAALYRFS